MTWKDILAPIKETEQFTTLWKKVKDEYSTHTCFPPKHQIFRAIELTPFEKVKVVIIGQDPYHNDYQANGLSFSVNESVAAPPSLRNIFQELHSDLGINRTRKDLQDWAEQGVLLLNATLTVRAHHANSHKDLGWDYFTDYIIKALSEQRENIVFVLWGSFAQKKKILINEAKHFVLQSAHPSPLSAHRGFFGSKPFSQINNFLSQKGISEIEW